MKVRMAGLVQKKSGIFWYRLAVPERHRAAIGKREILETLDTRDLAEAKVRHAAKNAQVMALFAQLDAERAKDLEHQGEQICRNGFDQLARRNLANHDNGVTSLTDAYDNVLWGMLMVLGFRVQCTWGSEHAHRAEARLTGEVDAEGWQGRLPVALSDADEQDWAAERIDLLESRMSPTWDDEGNEHRQFVGQRKFRGLAYRDLAAALLDQKNWNFVEMEVVLVAEAAGVAVLPGTGLFDVVAEKTLQRLAGYRSSEKVTRALATPVLTSPRARPASNSADAETFRTIDDAYRLWCKEKRLKLDQNGIADPRNKTADEWHLARTRFLALFGRVALSDITRTMLKDFRDILFELPSRPKKEVAALPLREQAAMAKATKLKRLHPNSVKKQITAIKAMLAQAVDETWINKNVAENIKVEGSGHTGHERDFFTLEELRVIFSSEAMTDPHGCDDTVFFIILLATLHGCRPGELAKLKPFEVCTIDDTPTFRIRATEGRGQKTDASVREFPVHDIAIAAGIFELAAIQAARGAEWLFDDIVEDTYGDRYKRLSRTINKLLRRLGITAPDKAFYSARHAHKREMRRQDVPEHNADQMTGSRTAASTSRKYGRGVPIENLKKNMDQLTYRGIGWDPVIQCSLERIERLRRTASLRSAC